MMMLSDKQSLILCCFVVLGFVLAGILNILDNFVIIALLCLAFIIVVLNLIIHANKEELSDEDKMDSNEKY